MSSDLLSSIKAARTRLNAAIVAYRALAWAAPAAVAAGASVAGLEGSRPGRRGAALMGSRRPRPGGRRRLGLERRDDRHSRGRSLARR